MGKKKKNNVESYKYRIWCNGIDEIVATDPVEAAASIKSIFTIIPFR
jgi:hypothetical protein